MPEPLLLAERQHPVPMRLFLDARGQGRQSDGGDQFGDLRAIEGAGFGRIGDGGGQGRDRKIRPLRQHHHAWRFSAP